MKSVIGLNSYNKKLTIAIKIIVQMLKEVKKECLGCHEGVCPIPNVTILSVSYLRVLIFPRRVYRLYTLTLFVAKLFLKQAVQHNHTAELESLCSLDGSRDCVFISMMSYNKAAMSLGIYLLWLLTSNLV